jgi:hypothetical protein
LSKASRLTAFVPVVAGTIGTQRFNNTRATTHAREPLICDRLGGASKWFGLRAKTNGTMVIDTIGSGIDTLLSAYRRTNLMYLAENRLECNDNGAPDGLRSVVQFPVMSGQDILVTIDGANGQQGRIVLNWKLTNVTSAVTARMDKSSTGSPQLFFVVGRANDGVSITVSRAGTNGLVLQSSTDLLHWIPVYTNPPRSLPVILKFPINKTGQEFFRVVP